MFYRESALHAKKLSLKKNHVFLHAQKSHRPIEKRETWIRHFLKKMFQKQKSLSQSFHSIRALSSVFLQKPCRTLTSPRNVAARLTPLPTKRSLRTFAAPCAWTLPTARCSSARLVTSSASAVWRTCAAVVLAGGFGRVPPEKNHAAADRLSDLPPKPTFSGVWPWSRRSQTCLPSAIFARRR